MMRNLITDVPGILVGNAHDTTVKTGTTVLTSATPFTCGVHVMGGAPGTRETDLLAPDKLVEQVDALVLSGGSGFGLDAGSGVADALRNLGRGFAVGDVHVPVVPGAIIFDLTNGGDKNWTTNPYRDLGARAFANASDTFVSWHGWRWFWRKNRNAKGRFRIGQHDIARRNRRRCCRSCQRHRVRHSWRRAAFLGSTI